MAESEKVNYKGAAKTTALFSVVQIIKIAVGIVRNKFVAVLLGPSGMGIMGVFHTYTHFVQTGACLGLSQSAVKDVSEANASNNTERISFVISLTNKLVVFTSLLGLVVTLCFSPFFSQWGFGTSTYTLSFVFLSLSVACEIFVENRLALLKGTRQLRSLAKTTIIGSVVGLITGIPIFFFLGEKGIVPSILVTSFSSVLVTNFFVNKIKYEKVKLSFKEIVREGSPMLKMGIALMSINFLSGIFDAVLTTYLSRKSGVETLGIFRSGQYLMRQCFGIVLTAMNTDYYPRICAVNKDNVRLKEEVNAQTKLGLTMVFPLAIGFISFASLIIPLLYSKEFINIIQYTDIAIIGTILAVPSNCIAMVLLAKQDAKMFTSIAVIVNVINLGLFISLFELWQLKGLGVAYVTNVLLQLTIYTCVIKRRHNISFDFHVWRMDMAMIVFVIFSVFAKSYADGFMEYIIGVMMCIIAALYSVFKLKSMGINVMSILEKFKPQKK